ncbi:MAG: SPOR domain-containing protein [Lysobacteraceae bacterium]
MDAALKQRLIGATVLVALAVIFLPMLVQGPEPDQSVTEAVPLDAPDKPTVDMEGRALETREILLPQPNGAVPTPADSSTPVSDDPNAVATVDTTVAPRVDAVSGESLNTASPVTATPETPSSANTTATTTTESLPTATTTPAPTPTPAPSPAQATPATATTAPATRPEPATASPLPVATASGNFAVNVGSYANIANAEALLAKLKAAGLTAYAESTSLDGKAVRRIRLGPFAQRGEAERARAAALRVQADLPTSVVTLDASTQRAEPARAAATRGFAVQVGAFRAESDANTLVGRLRGAGFTAFAERVNSDAGQLWRVRVGPELDRATADRRRGELKTKMSLDGMVVTHP